MEATFYLRGPKDLDRYERPNPSLRDLLDAIRLLDGKGSSGLMLKQDAPQVPYLGIAGGQDSMYVVFITVDGEWASHVINTQIPKGNLEYRLKCGGQKSDIDAHFVVKLDDALKAAEYFYSHQSACPELSWETT